MFSGHFCIERCNNGVGITNFALPDEKEVVRMAL